jgi:hypothetical protein
LNTTAEQAALSISNNGSVNTVTPDPNVSEPSQSLIGIDLGELTESIINQAVAFMEKSFEPVQLSFSTEIMSQQIQNVSIIL